jgi:hypothetical protein
MQLEKASSHSGEAGLAGWISTNDVTLFTMVLVVLISLFLHTNLVKRRKQNEALTKDLSSTSDELDDTRRTRDTLDEELQKRREELEKQGNTLDSTEESLIVTQRERDRLNKDLDATKTAVSKLEASLASLNTEKAGLESSKAMLEKERQELTKQTNTLATDKTTLTEQLTELGTTLEKKIEDLKGVEEERARLKKQADDLDKIVATLKQKLGEADIDLKAMEKQVETEKAQAAEKIKELEETNLAKLKRAVAVFEGLKADKKKLQGELTDAELRYQQKMILETTVNRELVGIKGDLKRVAVIFDASGSMKKQGTDGEGDRWQEAQEIAKTWLQHLNVDKCVLIVFSSDVRTFPEDGSLADLRGEDAEAVRDGLLEHLAKVEPKGWTNTRDALRKAYTYEDLDTIILFSDGAPTNPNSGTFDQTVANTIYQLCKEHESTPVNTVGLGNYFDKDLSTFLRTVARITGGTFRGR